MPSGIGGFIASTNSQSQDNLMQALTFGIWTDRWATNKIASSQSSKPNSKRQKLSCCCLIGNVIRAGPNTICSDMQNLSARATSRTKAS